ncbi:hypothetical protein HT576_08895 [Haloterrigena sp. SYSU A121-1]|uniref:Uncharacterized protein n=1 Tax=Haloterrigena gelatinilytica TaxID=2741724 RepID=A0A8J8KFL6_9EURY|nr:hypothetical protein [Haloterrigena gelatinilytica]NUB91137.1 hypothetical protein [Haloterrigena gelatinilytica]
MILGISILAVAAGIGSLNVGGSNGFDPDPDTAATDDRISIDTTVNDPTLVSQILPFDLEPPSLAVVDTADDTYAPGDTVNLEFTDTAHTSCDDTEFRVEVREPGSSVTDLRGSNSLQKYDGSVMTDQLVTGEVTIRLPDDAPAGEWEAMGYLYCLDDDLVGDPDHDTFTVETTSPEPEPTDDSTDDTDETDTDTNGDSGEEQSDETDNTEDTGEDNQDDSGDESTDETDDTDEDEERHWTIDAVLNLWKQITGVFR